jgi:hypothetical protein
MTWNEQFMHLFERSVERYRAGEAELANYYTAADLRFLQEIGYKPREFFDFVEDLVDEEAPTPTTALLIAAVRRDYLKVIQCGRHSETQITRDDLPSFGDLLEGISYLPRIIAKGRAKLRGELDPDLMYGCGGDRKFLREHNIHLADFLRFVWAAGEDDQKILAVVRKSREGAECSPPPTPQAPL